MSENSALSTDERFLCGFYMYPGSSVWGDYAKEQCDMGNRMTRADAWKYWIKRMVDYGFNTFRIGVANDPKDSPITDNPKRHYIGFFNDLAKEYNFNMIPHLESVYLSKHRPSGLDDKEYLKHLCDRIMDSVEGATRCIDEYKNYSNVLAFSVAEEPHNCIFMHCAMLYHGLIRESVGDVKFDLLFMTTPEHMPLYLGNIYRQKLILGVDPYIFGWEFSGNYYLAAPSARRSGAFDQYVRKLKVFGKYAREFNTHFKVTFTVASQERVIEEAALDDCVNIKDGEAAAAKKQEIIERIKRYAVMEEHGWLYPFIKQDTTPWGKDLLKYFRYYHPPQNCTQAMVWLAVMMGAKSIFQWALKPTPPDVRRLIQEGVPTEQFEAMFKEEKKGRWYWRVHILGKDNQGTDMLDEYKEACQDLQKFGWLINRMEYDDEQDSEGFNNSSSPLEISASDLSTKHDIYSKSFLLPHYSGKIVVLVNGKVGTWCNTRPQLHLSPDKEQYRINKWGYVHEEDFTPDVEDLSMKVALELSNNESLWDLESGECLISASNEIAYIDVKPGGGKFLFIGPARAKTSIRLHCGLE